MSTTVIGADRGRAVMRFLPLAGIAYGVLEIAGDLTIGPFPGVDTSQGRLASFYAAHHAQVAAGGRVMELAAVALGLFAVALAVRAWACGQTVAAALLLVGGAVDVAATETSATTYGLLGSIGNDPHVTVPALQAWHIGGAALGQSAGVVLLMLGVWFGWATVRIVPGWLAWTGLLLGLLQLTPFGFVASMLTLLWSAVLGAVLVARPALGVPVRQDPAFVQPAGL